MDMEMLLKKILDRGWMQRKDKILIICGNQDDDKVLKNLKFTNYLITSAYKDLPAVKNYRQADAQRLTFANQSYDVVIVNAGLHHCASPHQALCEMYRVAKRIVIVHEAQDSWLLRLMVKLNLALDYETGSIEGKGGGYNDTEIPNFVYRWTPREVIKTINSYDPTKVHNVTFFSSFRYYPFYLESDEYLGKNPLVKFFGKKSAVSAINLIVLVLNLFFRNQGNDFAFIIHKNISPLQPWINPKKTKLVRYI